MLKNRKTFFVPAVLTLALSLAGCPTNAAPPPVTIPPMTIVGQVYVLAQDADGENGEFRAFDGDRQVQAQALIGEGVYYLGGAGAISGGRLSFTIGRPSPTPQVANLWCMGTLFEGYDDVYRDFTVYPDDARGAVLLGLLTAGDGFMGWMNRYNLDIDGNTSTLDEVYFLYVDRDVTVTGRGVTDVFEGDFGVWRITTTGINIRLNAGWNVMHRSHATTITETGDMVIGSETVTLSAGDPHWVRWIKWEGEVDMDELGSRVLRQRPSPPHGKGASNG